MAVGHGQMSARFLEEIMLKFLKHEIDILVCTTIIESGIDVPMANTLIVNRADKFGLADLHQLRGRVGRLDVQAYAYFIVPNASSSPKSPVSGSKPLKNTVIWERDSILLLKIYRSAVPEIYWAPSSMGLLPALVLICIAVC